MKLWIAYNSYDGTNILKVSANQRLFEEWAVKYVKSMMSEELNNRDLSCTTWKDVSYILWEGGIPDAYEENGYFDYETYDLDVMESKHANFDFGMMINCLRELMSEEPRKDIKVYRGDVVIMAAPTSKELFDLVNFDQAKMGKIR